MREREREPATTLYFRAKIPPSRRNRRDDHVEIVCKASCTRRFSAFYSPSLFRAPPHREPSLSAFHPRNLSRLCRARGWNLYQRIKGTGRKNTPTRAERTLRSQCYRPDSIIPLSVLLATAALATVLLSVLGRARSTRTTARRSDAMKRSRREMQRQSPDRSPTLASLPFTLFLFLLSSFYFANRKSLEPHLHFPFF